MRVTVYETLSESFELEVPREVVAEGDDAIALWIENERVDGNHPRKLDSLLDVVWEKEE